MFTSTPSSRTDRAGGCLNRSATASTRSTSSSCSAPTRCGSRWRSSPARRRTFGCRLSRSRPPTGGRSTPATVSSWGAISATSSGRRRRGLCFRTWRRRRPAPLPRRSAPRTSWSRTAGSSRGWPGASTRSTAGSNVTSSTSWPTRSTPSSGATSATGTSSWSSRGCTAKARKHSPRSSRGGCWRPCWIRSCGCCTRSCRSSPRRCGSHSMRKPHSAASRKFAPASRR